MSYSVLSVFVLLLGGMGLPLGLPPTPEDPVLSQVAPKDCLAYLSWSGIAKASAESPNQTEQLLAEPEVVQMIAKIEAILTEKLAEAEKRSPGSPDARIASDIYPAIKAVLTRPAAIFLSKAGMGPQGPELQGGAVFKLDADGAMVAGKLEAYQKMMLPPGAAEKTTISGFSASKLKTPAGTITWGLAGKYLVVGVGDGAFEEILSKARGGSAPAWLADLKKQAAVARVSTVLYINVKQIVTQFAPMGGPQVQQVLSATGLTGVTSLATVTGLSDADLVSRTLIATEGEPAGVMHILSGKPLTAADLAPIPHDATFAIAALYDLDDVLATALKVAGQIEPRAADEAAKAIQQVEQALGVNIKDDLLKSLGEVWCFYNSPSEGGFLVTGITGVAQVRDHDRLATTLEKLVTMANSQLNHAPVPDPRGLRPKIEKFQFAGQDVYFFNARTSEFPFAPAWCLTEKELIVAGFPQNIKSYLSRRKGYRSLATSPVVASAFSSGDGPAVLTYLDPKQFAEVFYPMLCVGAQALAGQAAREGVPLDISLLPSASALLPHLKPSVGTLRRTAAGIELSSHGTIPALGAGPLAVAPFLYFVRARHEIAFAGPNPQTMNNLKQIALAMLTYEEAMGRFPTAYSADKTGKPLLSWRVAILPYLDQDGLYRQFHLDEPWDSPNNKRLINMMPPVYRSPASHLPPGVTNYLTFRCKESAFPGKEEIRMMDIRDGASNTLMVVEADDAKGVIWTKPDDLNFDAKRPLDGLGKLWPTGFVAALCDGSVHSFVPSQVTPATMKNLVGINDNIPIDWDTLQGGVRDESRPTIRSKPMPSATRPVPATPELPDPAAASKAMELYDANNDGFLDDKELETVPGLKAAKKQVDTDHDGKISEAEIAARIKSWADSQIGRMTVTCRVLHNGQPLVGAKVVFVPETFLDGGLQPGSGTTTATGVAVISSDYAADPTVKGLAPGFYRVQITKEGEKIHPKYNTETTLGAEAASRSEGQLKGLIFDLQY